MKKISIEESKKLLPYLLRENDYNVFIIGDIENSSSDKEYIDIYVDESIDNPKGVLLRYFDYFVIYADDKTDYKAAAEIIINHKKPKSLNGKVNVIKRMKPYLQKLIKKEESYSFLVLEDLDYYDSDYEIKKVTTDNIGKVIEFLKSIEEFRNIDERFFISDIKNQTARCYFIEKDNKVVSTASSTAESGAGAIIADVATRKKYRNKGYAKAIISKLCSDLLVEGKTPYILYDNPSAGKLYESIGFKKIGSWKILRFE
ncbi:MAG: GNAT family N-acetyltransferase [Kosmotogaceae bacterium]